MLFFPPQNEWKKKKRFSWLLWWLEVRGPRVACMQCRERYSGSAAPWLDSSVARGSMSGYSRDNHSKPGCTRCLEHKNGGVGWSTCRVASWWRSWEEGVRWNLFYMCYKVRALSSEISVSLFILSPSQFVRKCLDIKINKVDNKWDVVVGSIRLDEYDGSAAFTSRRWWDGHASRRVIRWHLELDEYGFERCRSWGLSHLTGKTSSSISVLTQAPVEVLYEGYKALTCQWCILVPDNGKTRTQADLFWSLFTEQQEVSSETWAVCDTVVFPDFSPD